MSWRRLVRPGNGRRIEALQPERVSDEKYKAVCANPHFISPATTAGDGCLIMDLSSRIGSCFCVAYPCRYVADVPARRRRSSLDLPDDCRIDNFADMDGGRGFRRRARSAGTTRALPYKWKCAVRSKCRSATAREADAPFRRRFFLDRHTGRPQRPPRWQAVIVTSFTSRPPAAGRNRKIQSLYRTNINRAAQDAPWGPAVAAPFPSSFYDAQAAGGWRHSCRRRY